MGFGTLKTLERLTLVWWLGVEGGVSFDLLEDEDSTTDLRALKPQHDSHTSQVTQYHALTFKGFLMLENRFTGFDPEAFKSQLVPIESSLPNSFWIKSSRGDSAP